MKLLRHHPSSVAVPALRDLDLESALGHGEMVETRMAVGENVKSKMIPKILKVLFDKIELHQLGGLKC